MTCTANNPAVSDVKSTCRGLRRFRLSLYTDFFGRCLFLNWSSGAWWWDWLYIAEADPFRLKVVYPLAPAGLPDHIEAVASIEVRPYLRQRLLLLVV